jgi:hypothetical protein
MMCLKNKIMVMSLIASTQLTLFGAVIPEDKGTVSGLVRLGYVDQDNAASTDTYATALGGILKYETPVWSDLKLGVAGYMSQKLHFATGSWDDGKTNLDFLGENGNSFAYVGEAYVDYSANDLTLRIGRQLIDTPLINTDEIRMLPNTYEAALATYSGIEKTTFTAGHIQRWAGYDSGADLSKFKKVAQGSHGATLIGFTNESIEELAVQGWFYSIDKMTDAFYVDAVYNVKALESLRVTFMGQYAHFNEDTQADGTLSGTDGNVYGLAVNAQWGMLTLGAAYNEAASDDGKWINNGLGGGPYYTSMEEWTIGWMEDEKAYQVKAIVDMKDAGVEGLSFTTLYGEFKSAPVNVRMTEWDVIATYVYNDALSADISYAMLNDKNDNQNSGSDAGYDRFLARLSYRF